MEQVSGLNLARCNVKELSDDQKAQVRKAIVEEYKAKTSNNLCGPNQDEFNVGKCCYAISPKNIASGVIGLTAVVTSLKTLAQTGFDIWDEFTKRFGKPESKEEEQALKAALNVEV